MMPDRDGGVGGVGRGYRELRGSWGPEPMRWESNIPCMFVIYRVLYLYRWLKNWFCTTSTDVIVSPRKHEIIPRLVWSFCVVALWPKHRTMLKLQRSVKTRILWRNWSNSKIHFAMKDVQNWNYIKLLFSIMEKSLWFQCLRRQMPFFSNIDLTGRASLGCVSTKKKSKALDFVWG